MSGGGGVMGSGVRLLRDQVSHYRGIRYHSIEVSGVFTSVLDRLLRWAWQ